MTQRLGEGLVYDNFLALHWQHKIDLLADTLKVLLVGPDYQPDAELHSALADVADEVAGEGYTRGGRVVEGKVLKGRTFFAADVVWPRARIKAWQAVLYKAGGDNPLVTCLSLGGETISTNGEFRLEWDARGILELGPER